MSVITKEKLIEMCKKTASSIKTVDYRKGQHDKMMQAAVDCLLMAKVRVDIEDCVNLANDDYTPDSRLIDEIFKLALIETARQL